MTNTVFDPAALKDILEWTRTDLKLVKKIFELITDIHKHPDFFATHKDTKVLYYF